MNNFTESFQQFFGPLSNAQRAMFVGLVITILSIMGLALFWSQQEEKALLFASLQPDAAQEIVNALSEKGVDYELKDDGQSIYVQADKVPELRLEMAPISGSMNDVKGYELFDSNSLGMTDFMQQVNKQRALEGELARSINSLRQVESSRIHLVLPERSPFEENSVDASASVILNLGSGNKLSDQQIGGITSLIAGSVQGLDPANVTVLDQIGNRLTDNLDSDNAMGFGGNQMQLRQKTESYLTERGQSMLDRVLGSGNSIVRVSVEHDFDRLLRESDIIDPDSRTIISEDRMEQNNNDEILEPLPIDQSIPVDRRGETVVVSNNDNSSSTQTRNYEVNRTREVFEKTQGEIKLISASVLLNYKKKTETNAEGIQTTVYEPYSEQEVEEFEEVVKLALGIVEDRGDKLSIKQVEFIDNTITPQNAGYFSTQPLSVNNIMRWVLVSVCFVTVMLLIRSMKKGGADPALNTTFSFQADDQLKEGEKAKTLTGNSTEQLKKGGTAKALEQGEDPAQLAPKKYSKDEITNYIELKPAEAANVLRALMISDQD